MPRYRVRHATTYTYDEPVSTSYGDLCLLPRSFPGQQRQSGRLTIAPTPGDRSDRVDSFGNETNYFSIHQPHTTLEIVATSVVDVAGSRGDVPLGAHRPWTDALLHDADVATRADATQFVLPSARVIIDDRIVEYATPSFDTGTALADALGDLCHRIHTDFDFDATATSVDSTIDELFEKGGGVCQDFAHLGVACARSMGLAARYMSGYLETDPPAGQPRLQGADVSHAWFAVLAPDGEWIDVDPTNDQFANSRYVTTAWGRDYLDVTPVKGVIYSDGGMSTLSVSVDVVRVPGGDDPSPSRPQQTQSQQQ